MTLPVTALAEEFDVSLRNNTLNLAVNDFPPSVTLISPATNTTVRFGSSVELAVAVAATNGVSEVAFYTNGVLFGVAGASPYNLTWPSVPAGTYAITVRATDGCGVVRTSPPVTLSAASNLWPVVAITSPLDRTRFPDTNRIRVTVAASDADGVVASVALYAGSQLLHTFASPPYVFIWSNAPAPHVTLRAVAVDNDGATNTSLPLLLVFSSELPGVNWTAYNDHSGGGGTHPNTTQWNIRGDTPGASGALKNITNGAALPVSLSIVRASPNNISSPAAAPPAGTPAAVVFGGYVDFTSGTYANVPVAANQTVTYTFTGLNPSRQYRLAMSAVRGNSNYRDRWTLLTLTNARSFRGIHTSGALTEGTGGLGAHQAAINTGYNITGDMAYWEDIVPALNGSFAVACTQYTGPIPSGGSGATGSYGYSPTMLRLQDAATSLPLVTTSAVSQTVAPSSTPTFTAAALGNGPVTFQWFHDDVPINGATSVSLILPPVQAADVGRYSLRVTSPDGHAMSRPAVLTLFSISTNRHLEISGPAGQMYQIHARESFNPTNLWMGLTNFVLPQANFTFSDPMGTNAPQRFYKATAAP